MEHDIPPQRPPDPYGNPPEDDIKCAWYHRLNPCDICRPQSIARLGDALAKLATDCPCCNGLRILGALAVGLALGALLG